jgi:Tfp pilus assembly protein PilV
MPDYEHWICDNVTALVVRDAFIGSFIDGVLGIAGMHARTLDNHKEAIERVMETSNNALVLGNMATGMTRAHRPQSPTKNKKK